MNKKLFSRYLLLFLRIRFSVYCVKAPIAVKILIAMTPKYKTPADFPPFLQPPPQLPTVLARGPALKPMASQICLALGALWLEQVAEGHASACSIS